MAADIGSLQRVRTLARSLAFLSFHWSALIHRTDDSTICCTIFLQVPQITGNDSLVRELALTGRFFNPQTALQLGLVSRVVKGSKAEVLGKQRFLLLFHLTCNVIRC
jgi:hypothetical protein